MRFHGPISCRSLPCFLTGAVAWVLCHPVRARITAWVDRHPDRHHLDWLVQHRPLATKRLVPLITPQVWAIGLWISVSVAEYGGWPHAVAQVAVNLLLAWLVIRLAAEMVPNPVLARLIAVLSWSVAALNITHLLGPTLELLDNAAIVVGGLRVSLLTVTKGVLSLTILALGGHAGVQTLSSAASPGFRRLRRGRGFCSESCSRPPWSASPSFYRWSALA